MAVDFVLLGGLDGYAQGHRLELGPARQRCVLAGLLVDANRTVSTQQLIGRVWDERPPATARETLSSYVSRLRLALAGSGAAIVRRSGGYQLAVAETEVDLHRFRQLAAAGRAAGDDAAAAALFGEALALYRGEALAGLETAWARSVRDQIAQERHAVELDRAERRLALGDHTGALAALSPLTVDHPMDERLAGHLMLALHGAGRTGDALDHYRRLRRRLADELGADPRAPLQELHQRILLADPSLVPAPRTALTPTGRDDVPGPPRQLPACPGRFVGRERELALLDAALDRGRMVVSVIDGPGGVGKTWLAMRWAHRNLDRFPDGQLYLNLHGFSPGSPPMPTEAAVHILLDSLGVAGPTLPTSPDAQAGLYRSLLSGRRMLVVLDNVRDTAQVVPLLPGSPTCTVLITSRNRLGGLVTAHGARPVSLDVLPDAEARRVLTTHLDPARLAAEPEAATELLSCCAGLPLALSIVSTRAATSPDLPLAALATELRDAATRLDGLDGGDLAVNLRAVFDASYRSLDAEAATVFRLLGLLPATDAGLDMIASLVGRPPAGARTVLRALERANLVRLSATGRYRTHDLVRLYAAELATGRERRTATVRLLDHLLYAVHAADRLVDAQRPVLTPPPCHADVTHPVFADRNAALAWLDAEHMALLGAVTVALDAGFLTHAWQLPRLLTPFLDRRGYWQEMSDVLDVALAAATALGDQRAEAGVHRDLARAHLRLRRPEHATVRLRRALDLYRELDDLVGQAQTNAALAWHLEAQGDVAEALEHARRALALHAAAGHQAGVAEALNAVGWYHALLGDYRSTLDYCGRALAMQRDMGSVALLGDTLDSLGYAHHHLAEYPMAIGYFQESLDVSRQLGARHNEGAVLTHLGDAYLATGDREAAGRAWLAALAVFTDLDAPDADGVRARLADLGVH